jgi:4-hydroxybenzoate polyprenyltransferase
MFFEKIKNYALLMRLDKPVGIVLLLWPTLWAIWLASHGKASLSIVIIFTTGVIFMRSAGCIINDIADRHVDGAVHRTQNRPLVTQAVSLTEAFSLFVLLGCCAFALVLNLNVLTIKLAFVGAGLAIVYPFLKRWTFLPQVGLGAAFSWGIPMAFAAIQHTIPLAAWCLYVTALIWPVIYDTMYAMVDKADDEKVGIKSTAILFGENTQLVLACLQVVFLACLILVGMLFQLPLIYYVSLIMVAMLCCYQQSLIKKRHPALYFKAFLNNQWVGFIIFLGILVSYHT